MDKIKKIILEQLELYKESKFEGIDNRLPKNYTPKIKIKIENERTHNKKGKKLPT
jgi:hypothetical protein